MGGSSSLQSIKRKQKGRDEIEPRTRHPPFLYGVGVGRVGLSEYDGAAPWSAPGERRGSAHCRQSRPAELEPDREPYEFFLGGVRCCWFVSVSVCLSVRACVCVCVCVGGGGRNVSNLIDASRCFCPPQIYVRVELAQRRFRCEVGEQGSETQYGGCLSTCWWSRSWRALCEYVDDASLLKCRPMNVQMIYNGGIHLEPVEWRCGLYADYLSWRWRAALLHSERMSPASAHFVTLRP